MSKTKAIISLMVFLLMVFSVSAQAEQASEQAKAAAGILPGNILYGLDKAIERIMLQFTLNQNSRAEIYLAMVVERLAELEVVSDEPELVAIAEEGLNDSIEGLELETETLSPPQRQKIIENFSLHLEQFKARTVTLPEEAQVGILTAISSQEKVLVRLQENLPEGLQRPVKAPGIGGATVVITPEQIRAIQAPKLPAQVSTSKY